VIQAGASPSAHVTQDAYERIASSILQAVKTETTNTIYLDVHGAMVAGPSDVSWQHLDPRIRLLPTGKSLDELRAIDSNLTATLPSRQSSSIA
jgi:hypothetical protein